MPTSYTTTASPASARRITSLLSDSYLGAYFADLYIASTPLTAYFILRSILLLDKLDRSPSDDLLL